MEKNQKEQNQNSIPVSKIDKIHGEIKERRKGVEIKKRGEFHKIEKRV
ncbi:MAG: hypothetical protein ACLFT7_00370 [Thermoplasmata archaeon]